VVGSTTSVEPRSASTDDSRTLDRNIPLCHQGRIPQPVRCQSDNLSNWFSQPLSKTRYSNTKLSEERFLNGTFTTETSTSNSVMMMGNWTVSFGEMPDLALTHPSKKEAM
jgi:hypothetical protein